MALALALSAMIGAVPAHAEIDDVISTMADSGSVPLHVDGDGFGQPVIDISIGGGDPMAVALDTGSRGLVVSIWDLPWQDILNELQHFSFDDINIGAFPAGFTVGLDIPTSVDFGGGIIAEHTVEGILGIGPNAGGSYLVTADLPGDLGKGVLIDEPGGRLVFGAQADTVDGLSPIVTFQGAPYPGGPHNLDAIKIQIANGPLQDVGGVFDSGGKGGWIPSDVWSPPENWPIPDVGKFADLLSYGPIHGGVPISIYAPNGELLYSYATTDSSVGAMEIMPDWLMKNLVGLEGVVNTGNAAFLHNPVYISNANGGAMTFYGPATGSGADTVDV